MKPIITTCLLMAIAAFTNKPCAQTYSPVAITGFNNDVFAEAGTNATTVTSTSLDLSNYIMYTASFGAANALPGGVANNGTIVNGTRTYQLAPYNGNNILYLSAGGAVANSLPAGSVTLSTPASFSNISLLIFASEDDARADIVLNFTDGTTFNAGNFLIQDWFYGTGAMYSGFGRTARLAAPPYTVDGYPGDPRFYPLDIPLNCANRSKQLQSITLTHTFGNTSSSRISLLALSGVSYTPVTATAAITPANCGSSNGSIALTATGGSSPLTYSWNTTPVQTTATATNLPPGNYTCTITDAGGCATTIPQIVPGITPAALAATASPATVCLGEPVTLSVIVSGGTATNYTWNPGALTGSTITVTPVTSTTYTVEGQTNGCTISATVDVIVTTSFPAPVAVTVATVTATSITFNWTPVAGATGYLVSVNGQSYAIPSSGSTGTTHTITGLQPEQSVILNVVAHGPGLACKSDPRTATAATLNDEIFIPTIFTPNSDGRNDLFRIYGAIITGIEMSIYNQWGQLVYQSRDLQKGWDGTHKGKIQPTGVYIFTSRLTLIDGSEVIRKGAISLLR